MQPLGETAMKIFRDGTLRLGLTKHPAPCGPVEFDRVAVCYEVQ